MDIENNDLQAIITHALNEMKAEQGSNFNIDKINLAELERRTGLGRGKLRKIKKDGFVVLPHASKGREAESTKLTGFTGVIDALLTSGISNSTVCFERLQAAGYKGGITTVKNYISAHKDLMPVKRQIIAPQGKRGRRYTSDPGESYQMDWGFINVETAEGVKYRIACFAMICHHCGERYIEFFPNARQENLFIGMIHAFLRMGIPKYVLTDNMKSVVIRRDCTGNIIWQPDYEIFMDSIGFETKLCKPRHPFTKGAVERLVRFVKDNFIPGRTFTEITDLNYEAISWCDYQNGRYHSAVNCIPHKKHVQECMKTATALEPSPELNIYLCPERKISFDGFVTYEGRRFGVPYTYEKDHCRVKRDGYILYIYDETISRVLTSHNVTWSKRDSYCEDQYAPQQPEEYPTDSVKAEMRQVSAASKPSAFSKFNFSEGDLH